VERLTIDLEASNALLADLTQQYDGKDVLINDNVSRAD
jgi:hypothetical protein